MAVNTFFHPAPNTFLTDLQQGIRYVYNGEEGRLPWPTTFEQLAQLPFAKRVNHHAFADWPVFHIGAPLRFGQFEIQGAEINTPDASPQSKLRADVPVDVYPLEVRLAEGGLHGYWQLKKYISQTLGKPFQCWERPNDQFHADWLYDGLRIVITYWFENTTHRADWDYTSLSIYNDRVYPDYFTDAYTQEFKLNWGVHWQTFLIPQVSVPHNYRVSDYVRFTPVPFQKAMKQRTHTLTAWFDESQKVVSIAQPHYALILPFSEDTRFSLETVDCDRGQYLDVLTLYGLTDGSHEMVSSPVGLLNPVLDALRKWTGV